MHISISKKFSPTIFLVMVIAGSSFAAEEVVRHPIPNSNLPIAEAIEVPASYSTVYLSGQVAPMVQNTCHPKDSKFAYGGNTKAQTVATLRSIENSLKKYNLGLGDIIKMQVFLVGDPDQNNQMDFSGFMEGYRQFFGTKEQPNLPVRSTMQVAALVRPGLLVEIEVVAVRQSRD